MNHWTLMPDGSQEPVRAGIAPIGLLFAPSVGEVSHGPEEDIADRGLVASKNVLLRTALRL